MYLACFKLRRKDQTKYDLSCQDHFSHFGSFFFPFSFQDILTCNDINGSSDFDGNAEMIWGRINISYSVALFHWHSMPLHYSIQTLISTLFTFYSASDHDSDWFLKFIIFIEFFREVINILPVDYYANFLRIYVLNFTNIYLCVCCVCVNVSQCMWRQKTTYVTWFCSFKMWN